MRRSLLLLSAGLTVLSTGFASAQNNTPRNLILFIPDGLRALKVTPDTAPAMAEVRDQGVNFKNSHSLFPTFTTPNASAMATGHYLGDTGDFSNTIYAGYPVGPANGSVTPSRRAAARGIPRSRTASFPSTAPPPIPIPTAAR